MESSHHQPARCIAALRLCFKALLCWLVSIRLKKRGRRRHSCPAISLLFCLCSPTIRHLKLLLLLYRVRFPSRGATASLCFFAPASYTALLHNQFFMPWLPPWDTARRPRQRQAIMPPRWNPAITQTASSVHQRTRRTVPSLSSSNSPCFSSVL